MNWWCLKVARFSHATLDLDSHLCFYKCFFLLGVKKKLKFESQSCERAELYVSHSSQVTAMGCTPPKWLPASLLLHLKGYSTLHWAQLERVCCFLSVSSRFSVNTVGFQDDPGVSPGDKSNRLPVSPGGFIQLHKLWKQTESTESAVCVVPLSNRGANRINKTQNCSQYLLK